MRSDVSTASTASTATPGSAPAAGIITPEALLAHWQGHRRLTRRAIEAFPEEQLFSYSLGGMRPFGVLVQEFLSMTVPTVSGVVTGAWEGASDRDPLPKDALLRRWDADTAEIDALWPKITPARFHDVVTAFGQWTMPVYDLFFYIIDNEIHHRGQGYVYLRSLGIEPPPFYER